MRVGAVVLAAGGGRRFRGTKQLADLGGSPLLAYAVRTALAIPALSPVVVVLGHRSAAIRAAVSELEAVDVVIAPDWQTGQAASLRCGVAALGDVDAAVVLLGDQPFIGPAALAAILDWDPVRYDAVRATYGGDPGHPVLLSRRLLDRVGELEGDQGFRFLLDPERTDTRELASVADPTDIDTRETLDARR